MKIYRNPKDEHGLKEIAAKAVVPQIRKIEGYGTDLGQPAPTDQTKEEETQAKAAKRVSKKGKEKEG